MHVLKVEALYHCPIDKDGNCAELRGDTYIITSDIYCNQHTAMAARSAAGCSVRVSATGDIEAHQLSAQRSCQQGGHCMLAAGRGGVGLCSAPQDCILVAVSTSQLAGALPVLCSLRSVREASATGMPVINTPGSSRFVDISNRHCNPLIIIAAAHCHGSRRCRLLCRARWELPLPLCGRQVIMLRRRS